MQHMPHWLAWWPTMIVVAVATVTDLRTRRVPDWLVLPFLLVGVVVSPWRADWTGIGRGFWFHTDWESIRAGFWHGLGQSLAGLAFGFFFFGLFFFWKGGMGAGDVKLAAAIGAWVGPVQLFWVLFFTSLAGGVMALCWMAYRKVLKGLLQRAGELVFGWKRSETGSDPENSIAQLLKRKLPYAPAIAVGTLMSFVPH